MNKLTLDELKSKYSDRPQPAEVVKAYEKPVPIEPAVPDIIEVMPEVTSAKMSNTPIVSFLVFAGIAMFTGFAFLVNMELGGDRLNANVLGEDTVQENVITEETSSRIDIPEGREIEPVREEDYEKNNVEEIVEENIDSVEVIEEEAEEPSLMVRVVDVSGGYVNVRTEPSLSGGAISRVPSGKEIEVLSEVVDGDDVWMEIEYIEGVYGWISGDFVEKI